MGVISVHLLLLWNREKTQLDNVLLVCFTEETETQSGPAESGASFGCQVRHSVLKKTKTLLLKQPTARTLAIFYLASSLVC